MYDNLVLTRHSFSLFFCYTFDVSMFIYVFYSFSQNWNIHKLELFQNNFLFFFLTRCLFRCMILATPFDFSRLSIFFQVKNGKSFWALCKFSGYWTFKKKTSSLYLLQFFMKPSSNSERFLAHLKQFTRNFCNITQPQRLFAFQYFRYDDSFVLRVTYLPSNSSSSY